MSNSSFGSGSGSYGQFWFGGATFPGFLYKKNVGVGGRRSTKMTPGGNITCNSATYLYNKYKPGTGGVGASSIANRRAKNRLATVCTEQKCFPCYNTLGQYSNYTHNPNGFIPCPAIAGSSISSGSVTPTPTPTPPSGTYTLTYNRNSSQGGTGTAPTPISYSGGSAVTISANTNFSATGKTFGGWNTSVFGTGTYYPTGSTLTMPYVNTILYAQWYNPSGTTYSVIYNGNTNTGGTAPGTVNYTQYQGVSITGNTGTLLKTGFEFYGWNTAANGSGTAYPVTSNGFTMPASNVTLYAQWVNTSTNYTLTYNGNGSTGGSVPSAPTSYPSGAGVSVLGQTSLTRSGYTFLGWNTNADGTGSIYQPGSSVVMNSNTTLYAQWAPGTVIKDCGNFTGELTIPSIYFSGSRTVYRDNTNNSITIIIPTYYSNNGSPYGTGNGPIDSAHIGNLKSTYATATISLVTGVYQINTTYTTAYTGGTYTQTSTLTFGSTYWPTGETISTVTIPSPNSPAAFNFNPSGTNINVSGGCFGGASYSSGVSTTNSVIAFYINFSNGQSTRVALGTQFRWNGTTNTYTFVFDYATTELAIGTTPVPISGTFTPTSSTGVNTS
jgi:uncharacterized repeat protein (TIGR02543 family)